MSSQIALAALTVIASSLPAPVRAGQPYSPDKAGAGRQLLQRHGMRVDGGVLHFSSIADYRRVVDDVPPGRRGELLGALAAQGQYVSLRSAVAKGRVTSLTGRGLSAPQQGLALTSEFFASLLSSDGVVGIGDHLIKINAATRKALVLPRTAWTQRAALLDEDSHIPGLRVFSTDDDVLERLEASAKGQVGTNGLFCSETHANHEKDEGNDYYDDAQRLRQNNKLVYQKVAIYFSLQGKTKTQYLDALGIWQNMPADDQLIRYYAHFKPRCRDAEEAAGDIPDDGGGNELNHRPYERSRGLNRYRYEAFFYGLGYWSRMYAIFYRY